jgi:hypothetical protein
MWFEASGVNGAIIPSDARGPYSQGYVCGWGMLRLRTNSLAPSPLSMTELLVA